MVERACDGGDVSDGHGASAGPEPGVCLWSAWSFLLSGHASANCAGAVGDACTGGRAMRAASVLRETSAGKSVCVAGGDSNLEAGLGWVAYSGLGSNRRRF